MIHQSQMAMSVDAMLEIVRLRGLRLNNLFQIPDGPWQANLTDGISFWEFGRSDTPDGAIRAALYKAATEKPKPARQPPSPTAPVVSKPYVPGSMPTMKI